MTISELLDVLPTSVPLRINVAGCETIVGETGTQKVKRIRKRLSELGASDAFVASIYPLWHAQELYIGCVRC